MPWWVACARRSGSGAGRVNPACLVAVAVSLTLPEHGAPGQGRMGTVSWASDGRPLAGYAAGCRRELERCGFSPRTVRGKVEVMGQLSRWLAAERLSAADLTVAQAGQFIAAWRAAGQRRVPTMQTLTPFVSAIMKLRSEGRAAIT
jgi:hypothetical protein